MSISNRALQHTPLGQKCTHVLFALSLVCIVVLSGMTTGCGSVQGTKSDYFGFRNNIPAPAPEVEQEVSQQAWTNPMQSGVSSSVAFVPVITPWYDGWSMFARPSARFWGAYDRMGWNSPWGGDPFYGGGYGYSGWGGNPWAFNSYYDPFWGYGSSFMFYSSPWQRYNPYFGAYTPFGFYRPLGYWSSQNFTSYNNNLNTGIVGGGNGDVYSPSRMRDAGVQRAYGNNASAYTGTNSYNNSTYVGTYTTNGATGGALSRGQGTGAEYKQNNPNNRASQYNGYSVGAGGNAASNYANYYNNPLINSGTTTKYSGYNGGSEATRYYPSSPSTNSVRSYGGYSGGASYGGSSSGSSSGGGWGGSKSSGGYSGSSSSVGSSNHSSGSTSSGSHSSGSSGGGARSRGGH
jgi:hypothetical protein